MALDPELARLYVLTKSITGAEGWASWVDAAFQKHRSFHLEDDLGFPAARRRPAPPTIAPRAG